MICILTIFRRAYYHFKITNIIWFIYFNSWCCILTVKYYTTNQISTKQMCLLRRTCYLCYVLISHTLFCCSLFSVLCLIYFIYFFVPNTNKQQEVKREILKDVWGNCLFYYVENRVTVIMFRYYLRVDRIDTGQICNPLC